MPVAGSVFFSNLIIKSIIISCHEPSNNSIFLWFIFHMCGMLILLANFAFFYICLYLCLYILEITASPKNCGDIVYTGVAKF